MGIHLFDLVLTDHSGGILLGDAGDSTPVAGTHLFGLVLTDHFGRISGMGTHLFDLVLTDDAGFFVDPG